MVNMFQTVWKVNESKANSLGETTVKDRGTCSEEEAIHEIHVYICTFLAIQLAVCNGCIHTGVDSAKKVKIIIFCRTTGDFDRATRAQFCATWAQIRATGRNSENCSLSDLYSYTFVY